MSDYRIEDDTGRRIGTLREQRPATCAEIGCAVIGLAAWGLFKFFAKRWPPPSPLHWVGDYYHYLYEFALGVPAATHHLIEASPVRQWPNLASVLAWAAAILVWPAIVFGLSRLLKWIDRSGKLTDVVGQIVGFALVVPIMLAVVAIVLKPLFDWLFVTK